MIETDIVQVYSEFMDFTTKEMKKAITQGIRNSGRELVKSSKQSLRKSVKNSNKKNPKYNDTLQQGVRMGKVKENKDGLYVHVLITSNNKTGSGSFRLHILESGSYKVGKRYAKYYKGHLLKKPRYIGVLKPTYFFKSANENFQSNYTNIMNSNINKAVTKINNKKFGKL